MDRSAHRHARLPRLLTILALLPLLMVACTTGGDVPVPAFDDAVATVQVRASEVVPGRFIVTVRDGVDPEAVASSFGLRPDFTYRHSITGFAGEIGEAARAGLMRDARVLRIEPDRTVHAFATQSNATWGLDRIDQRQLPLSGTYTYERTGANVRAYVIDTGIHSSHSDFGIRVASVGFTAFTDSVGTGDCNGHGTHVAGTIGGTTWGVAKEVTLVPVRVLNCNGSGTVSGVIAGVDWVTANHVKPAVANMSLGGGASNSLDDAVRASVAAGVTYAVAAGNGNIAGRQANACNYSPARVAQALTVSATTDTDRKASWANVGDCVDIFAPGVGITSAWHTSATATNTISGTSMAAPHVAGVAALYLQALPGASPAQVGSAIRSAATKGIVASASTANNDLLYSLVPVATTHYTLTVVPDGPGSVTRSPDQPAYLPGTTVRLTAIPDANATFSRWSGGGLSGSTSPIDVVVDNDMTVTATFTYVVGDPPQGLVASVTAYKVQGLQKADVSWSGATSAQVDIRRDGGVVATIQNSGSHTDHINNRGGGSYSYQVCEAGTSTCSESVTASF